MRSLHYIMLLFIAGSLFACHERIRHEIPALPQQDEAYVDYALASLDETIAREPDNASAYYRKADLLLKEKQPNQALSSIQKAIDIKGAGASYRLVKARAYLQKNRYREAFQEAKEAAEAGLKSVELYEVLAEASLQSHYFQEALLYSDSALYLAPKNYKNYLRKGLALAASKDTVSAEKNLLKSISLGAPAAEAYGELITLYTNSGNYQKARTYMERSLSSQKPDDQMRLLQARILRHTGNEDSARAILYTIKDSHEVDRFDVFHELKDWYFKRNAYDSATFYAQQMVELEPSNKEPMLTLARIYDRRRSYQSAIKTYEDITEMDSLYQESLHKIALEELTNLKRKVAYLWEKQQEQELIELKRGIVPIQTISPGSEE